jgi:curved DNA-binding protein CbpA
MGNNNSRQLTYQQYYDLLQKNSMNGSVSQTNGGGGNMASSIPSPENIDMTQVDPYQVLNVPRNFEWDQLKSAYRHAASLVHPDKGGNRHLFNVVTECFRFLANEYKARDADKPHFMLKQQSQDYVQKQQQTPYVHRDQDRKINPTVMDGMALGRFNKIFEENKLEDEETSHGYGNQMEQSSKSRDDINVPKLLKKFDQGKFNKVFDKVVPVTKEVVVYQEPQPLQLAKQLQYTEIGGGRPGDYTSSMESSIKYTDYMKAHTTSRLVDPASAANRPEYKNVDQYEKARDKTTQKPLTMKEIREKKEREIQEKQAEENRLRRVREKDQIASDHYERMNRLLLG